MSPIWPGKWPRIARTACIPFMVVGTAGTTAAGVIDPLPDLARFCQSENLWFHVDAAWGGAAILSPRLRDSSRRNRSRGFHHLRRAQMVLGADGSRDVLLPSSGSGRGIVSRRDSLHAGGNARVGRPIRTPLQRNGRGALSA